MYLIPHRVMSYRPSGEDMRCRRSISTTCGDGTGGDGDRRRAGIACDFVGGAGTFGYAGTDNLVTLCCQAAARHDLSLALHLDHHASPTDIAAKVRAGVRSVMSGISHSSL
ncbi:D-tagatose-1,6-bisphosphate aldolase subunit GatY [Edwardsiella ictaluri]|nr:D-tagatose-1,6-bisphosphate aldolase subunit GatY [Edwardsiella ictaluri]